MCLSSFILLILCNTQFSHFDSTFHSQQKCHLVVMYNSFICCWVRLGSILLRIFTSRRNLFFNFFLSCLWPCYQDTSGLIECVMKYFLFFFLWKSLKIDANSSVDMWKNSTERPSSLGLFFVAIFLLQTLSLYFLQVYSGFLFLPESVLVARNLSISSSYLICWHAYSIPLYPLYFCKVCSNAFFFVLPLVMSCFSRLIWSFINFVGFLQRNNFQLCFYLQYFYYLFH